MLILGYIRLHGDKEKYFHKVAFVFHNFYKFHNFHNLANCGNGTLGSLEFRFVIQSILHTTGVKLIFTDQK